MRLKVVIACVLAAACGDNTHNVVQVDFTLGTADLIKYRADPGGWQVPTLMSDGSYTFEVVDDFELVAVFASDDGTFYAEELEGTYGEASHWVVVSTSQFGALAAGKTGPASIWRDPCWPFPRDGTVAVTGRMAQAGNVTMDTSCKSSTTAPWTFSLDVLPGSHDFIATGQDGGKPRIAIERDQQISAATALPTIDLGTGMPMDSTPIVISNPDSSSGVAAASTKVILTTAYGAADVSSTFGNVTTTQTISAVTVPPSILEPDDSQALEVHSPGGDYTPVDRSARTLFTGTETRFDLIPPPVIQLDVADGVDAVSWDAPLATRYGYVDFNVESELTPTSGYSAQHVTATKQWLEDHHAKSIAFDTSVPGYLPSWAIDRTQNYERFFDVRDDSTNITYMTTENSTVQGSPSASMRPPKDRYRVGPNRGLLLP